MKPNVGGAIAEQLVVPLRSLVKLVGSLHIIEEKSPGSFRGRRNQVIEINVFEPIVGAQLFDGRNLPRKVVFASAVSLPIFSSCSQHFALDNLRLHGFRWRFRKAGP
jgi:hypothetical protein